MIAAKVMASAPSGHAVTIQKSSAAPITTNARPALTRGRQPIGYAETATDRAAINRPRRIGNEQCQPVERVRNAGQHFRRLIGEQPQRRRSRRQGDQPPHRRVTGLEQTRRVGDPACRLVFSGLERSSSGTCSQHGARLLPGARSSGNRASRTATVRQPARAVNKPSNAVLQDRGMVAELGGFAERLVDGRVERDDPADEFAPDRLGALEFGPGGGQCVDEPPADLRRNGCEQAWRAGAGRRPDRFRRARCRRRRCRCRSRWHG